MPRGESANCEKRTGLISGRSRTRRTARPVGVFYRGSGLDHIGFQRSREICLRDRDVIVTRGSSQKIKCLHRETKLLPP